LKEQKPMPAVNKNVGDDGGAKQQKNAPAQDDLV
jgi:hypothetical protein